MSSVGRPPPEILVLNPVPRPRKPSRPPAEAAAPRQPVVGLEAEFNLLVGEAPGAPRKPEELFGTPRALVAALGDAGRLVPRQGRSCHLPSGGALYFDTGVIEVATGLMELDGPAGCRRAVRALWEQVAYLRRALDAHEVAGAGPRPLRLQGFSAHYNFSQHGATPTRLRRTARLLPGVLLAPLALLASNRQSTAIGARPRPGRMEITLDFTPDPALMTAALAFLAGVIHALAAWPETALTPAGLRARGVPYPAGFTPRKHSSRQGWRAHAEDFPASPFTADPHAALWPLTDGRRLGLRAWARATAAAFAPAVRRFADRETGAHLREVFAGEARSGLDFADRPPAYDDVGRQVDLGRREHRALPRSAYERVIRRILARAPWRLDGARWRVERMPGWYEFIFREVRTGERRVFNLDRLAAALRAE